MFKFPNELITKWEGGSLAPKRRFISYLKSWKLISKGCLYHLVWIKDSNLEGPFLHSVPVVNEFLEVFLNDLPGIPPDREVDFGINIVTNTHPILFPL